MTKAELIDLLVEKENLIADLNLRIDELEGMAISSAAAPVDADTSKLLEILSKRVKELEARTRED